MFDSSEDNQILMKKILNETIEMLNTTEQTRNKLKNTNRQRSNEPKYQKWSNAKAVLNQRRKKLKAIVLPKND